jgi:AbiU2
MSGSKTAQEVLADYVAKMGHDLGTLFNAASHEFSEINWRWNQLRILFGGQDLRQIAELNQAAPFFFSLLHNMLYEDAILGIVRLIGPRTSPGQTNLTLKGFPELIGDSHLRLRLQELIDTAVKSVAFGVAWRHKRFAHSDLAVSLSLYAGVQALAPVEQKQVEAALMALRDVLNCIEEAYCGSHTVYLNCPVPGDARQLLYIIRHGLAHDRDQQSRLLRGEVRDDDIKPLETTK